jgi:hypothetical protein
MAGPAGSRSLSRQPTHRRDRLRWYRSCMSQTFRAPVMKTFPLAERLRVFEGMGELLDDIVLGSMPYAERPGSGERMILGGWAQAHTTFGAIVVVANKEDPDGQTVVMLSRPLFEAMVDIYWTARNPIKAQELATAHYRLLQIVIAEDYNSKLRPGDRAMPIDPANLADRERLSNMFGLKARKHWTKLDLRARAKAVDSDIPQDRQGELDSRFDEDHFLANLVLHGSSMSINDRLTGSARGLTVQLGATQQHLANGLRHAYWSYYRIGRLLVERLAPSRRDDFDEGYRNGWPRLQTISVETVKAAGRNGACPCGSNRKSKDCHGGL